MKLPAHVKAIRDRFVGKFPLPQGAPGDVHEERCRQWSIHLSQQIVFEGNPSYGVKRADPNRPISKDSIAERAAGSAFFNFDMMLGAGTGAPTLIADPDGVLITDQIFVEVEPFDWIGEGGGGQEPDPDPVDCATKADLDALEARLMSAIKIAGEAILIADGNGERRYQDLTAQNRELKVIAAPRGQVGTVKIPILGTGQLDSNPK